jgi:hypothetical protein
MSHKEYKIEEHKLTLQDTLETQKTNHGTGIHYIR